MPFEWSLGGRALVVLAARNVSGGLGECSFWCSMLLSGDACLVMRGGDGHTVRGSTAAGARRAKTSILACSWKGLPC